MAQTDEKIKKDKLTAGDKCAFGNMIFAKTTKEGWTLATKALAVTYIDLSEKYGCAFASQPYLQFRTGMSQSTLSRANKVLKESKLFELRYLSDDSLEVTPNLERIRAEYEKYQEEERCFKQERKDKERKAKKSSDDSTIVKMTGAIVKMTEGHRQNDVHILSTESLHSNPSKFSHTASDEAVEIGTGSEDERPAGAPADGEHIKAMTEYVECLSQQEFIRVLEESLPAYVPFDEHRPQRDPARASENQFKKLMRLGWNRLEILQGVEAYLREFDRHDNSREFHGNGKSGKTLGGLLADMVGQCNPEYRNMPNGEMFDGWHIPSRFLIDKPVQPPAAGNDNQHASERWQAAGDLYGTYGGECDPNDPF
jgi:hypothetical protein